MRNSSKLWMVTMAAFALISTPAFGRQDPWPWARCPLPHDFGGIYMGEGQSSPPVYFELQMASGPYQQVHSVAVNYLDANRQSIGHGMGLIYRNRVLRVEMKTSSGQVLELLFWVRETLDQRCDPTSPVSVRIRIVEKEDDSNGKDSPQSNFELEREPPEPTD